MKTTYRFRVYLDPPTHPRAKAFETAFVAAAHNVLGRETLTGPLAMGFRWDTAHGQYFAIAENWKNLAGMLSDNRITEGRPEVILESRFVNTGARTPELDVTIRREA